MFKALVLTAVAALPLFSHAGVLEELAKIEATATTCVDKATSNVETTECSWDAYRHADVILNTSYQAIVKPLKTPTGDVDSDKSNAETLKRLITAERAWIPFRDAECNLQGTSILGGTGEGQIVGGCLFAKTAERIRSLQELFNPN